MPHNVWHQNCVLIEKHSMILIFTKKIFHALFLILTFSLSVFAQKSLPNVQIKDLKGQVISTQQLSETHQPIIISFWATWCKPCLQEINAIQEHLEDWEKETNVKFIAISIDDSRSKARVPTFVNSKKWKFDVYIDENGDFQRALNVLNVPHTFILDGNGKIIYQHTSYALGDEEEYIDIVRRMKKSSIKK